MPTRFEHANGEPMCAAGLWEWRPEPVNGSHHSYAMLTINAGDHPLMKNYHALAHEKRMLLLLPRATGGMRGSMPPMDRSMDFMRQFPAELLAATPDPRPPKPKSPPKPRRERVMPKNPPGQEGLFDSFDGNKNGRDNTR